MDIRKHIITLSFGYNCRPHAIQMSIFICFSIIMFNAMIHNSNRFQSSWEIPKIILIHQTNSLECYRATSHCNIRLLRLSAEATSPVNILDCSIDNS